MQEGTPLCFPISEFEGTLLNLPSIRKYGIFFQAKDLNKPLEPACERKGILE